MKGLRGRKGSVFVIFLMLTMTASVVLLPGAMGHSPPINIQTFSYISAAPNPVGVNQTMVFTFWNTLPPPQANSTNNIRWTFSVIVTRPDRTNTSLGLFMSDLSGAAYTSFTPNQVGNYSVTVFFQKTLYAWNSTAGERLWTNDTFLTSSDTADFVVQANPVPTTPLPADYWTTSIESQTQSIEYFRLRTGWLGLDGAAQSQDPISGRTKWDNGSGPLTPHVMWTKPLEQGGVVGGSDMGVPGQGFYTGLSYNQRFLNTFIIRGILFYRESSGMTSESGGYIGVDLRTGQELIRSGVTSLNQGYYAYYNGTIISLLFSSSNYGTAYDPKTLSQAGLSISGVPSGEAIQGPNGEHLRIILTNRGNTTNPNWRLMQWNSSKLITPTARGTIAAGGNDSIDWDVPVTFNGVPFSNMSTTIRAAFIDDVVLTGTSLPAANFTYWAISTKAANRGAIIWNQTCFPDINGTSMLPGPVDPINHVFTISHMETMQWVGYNYYTGAKWNITNPQTSWDFYGDLPNDVSQPSLGHRMAGYTAYGRLYSANYGGILYCYNMSNGKILWTYGNGGPGNSTNSGFATPYGDYPSFVGAIRGGKVYLYTNEHSPNTPIYKGAQTRCIDAETGKEIWTLPGFTGAFTTAPSYLVAEGYGVWLNAYDQQIYCVGQGPSSTTLALSSAKVTTGKNILIQGTVIDVANGTMQSELAARFPHGVPAVSDADMTAWMEYIYMDHPRPQVTGVIVNLKAIDSTGTVYEIGNVPSDSNGAYSYVWAADLSAGDYSIVATFLGTQAYSPSIDQKTLSIENAPETPPPPVLEPSMTDTYILASTAGIIIVIAVATAVIVMLLRKGGK